MAKAYINGTEINKFVVDGGGVKLVDGTKFSHSSWSVLPSGYDSYIQSQTNWGYMFSDCSNLTTLDVSNWDTSKVTNMEYLFNSCSKISTLDVSNWDTSKVTNMKFMFNYCNNLLSLDVSSFNTSNVTNMASMFYSCKNITSLDFSSFDTSKVTSIASMLDCEKLKTVMGKINCISISSVFDFNPIGYSQRPNLRYITFSNLGYQKGLTATSGMERMTNWGVNSDEIPNAKQSLIDTLITYSFDRASAGYSTCTITLSANSKALLSEDEIAEITSKGFTIA